MGGRQTAWKSISKPIQSGFTQYRKLPPSMAQSTSEPVSEGILAIAKPSGISSAQVIRDVQRSFNPSTFFKPGLDRELERRSKEPGFERRKRSAAKRAMNVKIGHGGTLDPLATGVLILGIGSGTKKLGHFMTECHKQYEAVLLFGAATDTYDTEGKILSRKSYEHVTQEAVKTALQKFKGDIMQKPPIYSALRFNGKRFYEYAREGKEIPMGIKERPVSVLDIEVIEWMDGGTHPWHWPEREAEFEEKEVAKKALQALHAEGEASVLEEDTNDSAKRRREASVPVTDDASSELPQKRVKTDADTAGIQPVGSTHASPAAASSVQIADDGNAAPAADVPADEPDAMPKAVRPPCPAPACRIRMDVTSGFYVRSLCHDLGAEVGSLGLMASLVRTRQGQFRLGENVLPYEDVSKGEEVWGPKVEGLLKQWQENESKAAAA